MKVWRKLKSLLLGTPPYNNISEFNTSRDGRRAWSSLLQAYEGSDFEERMRDMAFAKLKQAHYRGETKTFTWEKYVNIHKQAHKMLIDGGYNAGRGMDEETKVQHIKANIKHEAGLESALMISRSNNTYRYNFDLFVSFISTEVNARSDRHSQLQAAKDRRVSKLGLDKGDKNRKGDPNRVPDSVKYKGKPSRVVDGMTVYGVKYPWFRFKKMNDNQRKAVIELKRQSYASNNNNTSSDHTIKALEAVQEDMSKLEDRLVAGITRGQSEPGDDLISTSGSSSASSASKRTASSGSIGTFLANAKTKQRRGN